MVNFLCRWRRQSRVKGSGVTWENRDKSRANSRNVVYIKYSSSNGQLPTIKGYKLNTRCYIRSQKLLKRWRSGLLVTPGRENVFKYMLFSCLWSLLKANDINIFNLTAPKQYIPSSDADSRSPGPLLFQKSPPLGHILRYKNSADTNIIIYVRSILTSGINNRSKSPPPPATR
jgi:hypothetical protein